MWRPPSASGSTRCATHEALHELTDAGHRGCRLAVSYPEIAEMQARAIFEAAVEAGRRTGSPVVPEIMVPLVGLRTELDFVKARIDAVARSVMDETGTEIGYLTGTMIELPRAAIRAHVIAESAEFFSFGTNDLTQTTFGISRDDAPPSPIPIAARESSNRIPSSHSTSTASANWSGSP